MKNIKYLSFIILIIYSFSQLSAQNNKTDAQGRKQGVWVKYKDGVKFYEGAFKDGYPIGEFKRYFKSGRLKIKSVYSEKGTKRQTEFYYDERKNILKAEGLYIEKRKEGDWKFYNETGNLVSEENWRNDTAHGPWKLYDYLGNLVKETPYTKGYINGLQKEYFENGNLKRMMSFKMDTLNGSMEVYFPEGPIRIEGYYSLGVQDNKWTYYRPEGEVLFIETYEDGFLLNRKDSDGNEFQLEVEQDTVKLDIDPSEVDFK